jgi:hypothetical protein
MPKFDSAESEGYKTVEGEIFKWVKKLRPADQVLSSSALNED